jgi:hypothetical protein
MADKQKCDRCGGVEYIPTFQFVKFDDHVQHLCSACWQHFRQWFFVGNRPERGGLDSAA